MQRPVFAQASLLYDFPQSYGLTAGINRPFASVIKNKVHLNGRITSKQKEFFFAANVGFYRYPFNSTGLFLFPSVGIRRVKSWHYQEFAAGAGLLRTFYDGRVYEVDAAGNVKELSLFGRFYATANFSYAIGWQLKKPSLQKLDIQVKPQLWFQFPYNSFIKPHISVEAGLRYHFNNVNIKSRVRTKHINR